MIDLIVGQTYYFTDAGADWGRSEASNWKLYSHQRKVELVSLYVNNDSYQQLADVKVLLGHPLDIGRIIQGVDPQFLASERTYSLKRKLRVYSPTSATYLSSPFSSGGYGHMDQNRAYTQVLMENLLAAGHHVFSPIMHTALLCHEASPLFGRVTALQWREYNETWLRRAEQLLIYTMPNWNQSIGVQQEIDFFINLGRQNEIYKIDENLNIIPLLGVGDES